MLVRAALLMIAMLSSGPLLAQSCGSLPYTLTNGTNADATQVMANYTHLLNCINAGGGAASGLRNRVINGDMRIDQANGGTAVTVNASTVFYGPDMWLANGVASAGTFSMQQASSSPPAGYKYYTRITTGTADATPAAGSAYWFGTRIEGLNVIDFSLGNAGAIQFTASFWVRSSQSGTFSGAFTNGTNNRSYPFSFSITSANTWQQVSVTLTGDTTGTWATDNTTGLWMSLDVGSGSNYRSSAGTWQAGSLFGTTGSVRLISTASATLDLTAVQVEAGGTATAFEQRGIQEEIARAQRYFMQYGSNGAGSQYLASGMMVNGSTGYVVGQFPVRMRVAPTMSVNAASDFAITQGNVGAAATSISSTNSAGTDSWSVSVSVSGSPFTVNAAAIFNAANAAARLSFSARL